MNSGLVWRVSTCVVALLVVGMSEASGRPYLRSNLARAMYTRMLTDERLRTMDLTKLYNVDELALTDEVRQRFVQLSPDEDTRHFLDDCFEQSEWLVTQVWHSVAKAFLGLFMTQTSVNGLLNRGRMFVWSEAQARVMLGATQPQSTNLLEDDTAASSSRTDHQDIEAAEGAAGRSLWVGERLLDLGAGDGYVTRVLGAGAGQVDATETSSVMRRRLRERGYRVLDAWEWMREAGEIQYNVVTCLNLLDRCDTPRSLLGQIHAKLTTGGTLVVALVLPFSPYVETGTADNLPSEELGLTGSSVEEQVNSLATEVFPSLGYTVTRWSRLPYLCEGDLDQAFYWLSDIIFVLKKDGEKSHNVTKEAERYDDALDKIKTDL